MARSSTRAGSRDRGGEGTGGLIREVTSMTQVTALCLGLALLAPGAPRPGGPDRKQVEELLKQLQGNNPAARARAAEALSRLGPGSNDAIPVLIKALKMMDGSEVPPVAAKVKDGFEVAPV